MIPPYPDKLLPLDEYYEELSSSLQQMYTKSTWVVLFGGWGLPAAVDIESKFVEAALKNIQLADYRNFAHGRHHWLAKRPNETAVLALITPEEEKLARQTLDLLP